VQREVVGSSITGAAYTRAERRNADAGFESGQVVRDITAPATPAAQQWQGWGTALKPAFEPIVVARKPLDGTVAENVLRHGTGALNIDGSRIGTGTGEARTYEVQDIRGGNYGQDKAAYADRDKLPYTTIDKGRWPANVILDESQAAELDRQSGVSVSRSGGASGSTWTVNGDGAQPRTDDRGGHDDTVGASRFFYVPKANASERPRDGDTAHPTVKPLDLMRYLVKLVTPPGGTVLEPFAGSGTTLEACVVEGFHVIGIELTEDYLPLIVQRLSKPIEQVLW
jgi:site-specific DNA-methyltransferase (adenine-specific)